MTKKCTKLDFIEKAKSIHGDKYDYSLVDYINAKTKVKIICPDHGVFEQKPEVHYGNVGRVGCPSCAGNKKYNTLEFIEKAKSIHGDKYDYSLVEYVTSKKKVKIICPDHGVFEQIPNNHLNGAGCSNCGNLIIREKITSTKLEFIEKAKSIHGDKYDYSLVEYVGNKARVKIICPDHGVFEQIASGHTQGNGCPSCSGIKRLTTLEFIERAKSIHGNKYDYSLVEYVNNREKVKIICPDHGVFEQRPEDHRGGFGCSSCSGNKKYNTLEFIEKAKSIHGDKYDYSLVDYTKSKTKVKIICPNHGVFEQIPNGHLLGYGCPRCVNLISKGEQEVFEFIKSNTEHHVEQSNRTVLDGLELDIYIPELMLAVEYNGIYFHSKEFRKRTYHRDKTIACKKKGITLIHIRSDLWEDATKNKILKSIILHKLGGCERIFARKCELVDGIDFKEAKEFYNNNHIQGAGTLTRSQRHTGLLFDGKLVMLMSFDVKKKYLVRLCSLIGMEIIGGATRLLSTIDSDFYTYLNNDYGSFGDQYDTLKKFNVVSKTQTEPNYWYVCHGNMMGGRSKFQKHKLSKLFDDYDGSGEHDFLNSKGYFEYYDSGNTKLVLKAV